MNKQLFYFLLCSCAVLFGACKNDKDISAYYFPVKALREGKVYEYRYLGNNKIAPEYWYHQTLTPDPKASDKKGDYFTSTLYDIDLNVRQIVSEEIVSNGMLLDDLHLYFKKDSSQTTAKVQPTIVQRNVYPFEIQDTSLKYVYKIHFKDPFDTLQTTYLTRTRKYAGKTTYNYKGQTYDCVMMNLEETIDNDREGHLEFKIYGKELYAKGIGLIYYKKGIRSDFALEYELADIYPMTELEKKLK
jgi:hypothetical protein